MPLRIRKLTRKQNAALKTYRDKWRALVHSTEPADREKAERGVRLMYSAWGLPAPKKYIWVENPADAFLLAARTRYTAKPVDTKIVLAGWSTINSTIDGISTHILDKLRMRGAVLHNRQLNSYIFRCASAAMADRKNVFNTYFAVEPSSALIPTVALVDFACNELGHRKSDLLDGAILLSQSCERWWPFATKAIMCERPHKYAIDQAELLHCEDGKAIEYPDGWGVYCWHGTLVPEHVILRPETITADDITNEENVEVRRVMLRRFGEERYIKTVGAHIVATDAVGQLVEAPLPGDESLKMVRVRNSTPEPDGSHRHYWLRVPPTMMTPRQAVAWSFNLKEQHYRPSKET